MSIAIAKTKITRIKAKNNINIIISFRANLLNEI